VLSGWRTRTAGELGQDRIQAGDMVERERADDDVRAVIGQRQPVKLADPEPGPGDTLPRAGEHVR
jgi:hypothetical protein